MTTEGRKKTHYNEWYKKHAKEYNAKRREQYAADPELRRKRAEAAREQRRRKASLPKPDSGRIYRELNGRRVEVVRIGTAAESIGRTVQVIRGWEAKKLVPPPVFPSGKRYYTFYQVELLRELAETINEYRYSKERAKQVARVSKRIHQLWEREKK